MTSITIFNNKVKYLVDNFPWLYSDQIIYTKTTRILRGDILIDTNLKNLKDFKGTNKNKITICINKPFNNKKVGYINYRANSIKEIEPKLLSLW